MTNDSSQNKNYFEYNVMDTILCKNDNNYNCPNYTL